MTFEHEFIQGFIDGAPNNYSYAADTQTDAPWCAPWLCDTVDGDDWFCPDSCPFDMGRDYARSLYEVLEEAFRKPEV